SSRSSLLQRPDRCPSLLSPSHGGGARPGGEPVAAVADVPPLEPDQNLAPPLWLSPPSPDASGTSGEIHRRHPPQPRLGAQAWVDGM
ncbi:unnamed protein product, partial [Urochloa humidicola]